MECLLETLDDWQPPTAWLELHHAKTADDEKRQRIVYILSQGGFDINEEENGLTPLAIACFNGEFNNARNMTHPRALALF